MDRRTMTSSYTTATYTSDDLDQSRVDTEGVDSSSSEEMVKNDTDISEVLGSAADSIEEYVIIDPTPKSSMDNLTERIFGDITKASACKQLGIGGATGWVAGYMTNKLGKFAAVGVFSGLLLVQVAQYNGYIHINWTKVQRALTDAQVKARHSFKKHSQSFLHTGQIFYEDNFFLASGFAAGFFIGLIW